jgi:putative phosphoesterase
VRVAILSDTHFPGRGVDLPAACLDVIARSDLIIHAGDLADMPTLALLRGQGKPLVAVHGNADDDAVRAALPATAEVALPGLTLAVVHNGGPEQGRLERMRTRFPGAGGVVFGHSHIPLHERAPDGFFILNPGSATDRRRQPRHSMVELTVVKGRAPRAEFLAVDDPVGPLPDQLVRGRSG